MSRLVLEAFSEPKQNRFSLSSCTAFQKRENWVRRQFRPFFHVSNVNRFKLWVDRGKTSFFKSLFHFLCFQSWKHHVGTRGGGDVTCKRAQKSEQTTGEKGNFVFNVNSHKTAAFQSWTCRLRAQMFGVMKASNGSQPADEADSTLRDENKLFEQSNAENSNKLRGEKCFEKTKSFPIFPIDLKSPENKFNSSFKTTTKLTESSAQVGQQTRRGSLLEKETWTPELNKTFKHNKRIRFSTQIHHRVLMSSTDHKTCPPPIKLTFGLQLQPVRVWLQRLCGVYELVELRLFEFQLT